MIHFHDYVQGSQEWLDARVGKVTCSNALTLLDKGKQACLIKNSDAANRITPNGNGYAERGHVLEHEVRELLNVELADNNLELVEAGMITNDKYPDAAYSPDGLVCHPDKPTGEFEAIVEIKAYNDVVEKRKSTLRLSKGEYVLDEFVSDTGELMCHVYVGKHAKACESYDNVPIEARVQIQMELLISEAPVCYLILYNPEADPDSDTPRVKIWTVEPDPKIQRRLQTQLLKKLPHD